MFSGPIDPVALVTALTAFVAAVGVAIKQIRDGRRERKSRKRSDDALEKVSRAAARHSSSVADVVDELERTGSFQRPTSEPRKDA